MSYRFVAREDFFSEETRSQYTRDLVYTVRNDNQKLHDLVQVWQGEGKVEVLPPETTDPAKVSGEGKVE